MGLDDNLAPGVTSSHPHFNPPDCECDSEDDKHECDCPLSEDYDPEQAYLDAKYDRDSRY